MIPTLITTQAYWIVSSGVGFQRVLVSSWANLTLRGEGASLALVDHPSSDVVTIKYLIGVDVLLHRLASHLIFSYWVG